MKDVLRVRALGSGEQSCDPARGEIRREKVQRAERQRREDVPVDPRPCCLLFSTKKRKDPFYRLLFVCFLRQASSLAGGSRGVRCRGAFARLRLSSGEIPKVQIIKS